MPWGGYNDAFEKLGYTLTHRRMSWSAQNEVGVCLSLYTSEIEAGDNDVLDTRCHTDPVGEWRQKYGARERERHIDNALQYHGGWVDVVLRRGAPKSGFKTAKPWYPAENAGKKWRIVFFR